MKVSCVIGVVDEEESLKITVNSILLNSSDTVEYQVVLVVAPFASIESRKIAMGFSSQDKRVAFVEQELAGIGGAYQQGFLKAKGDIIILMSSDLETDPKLVPIMVAQLMSNPEVDIIAVSRWLKSDSFEGYSSLLRILNYLFQRIIRVLYGSDLTDFTYAFRAYRRDSLIGIEWTERSHSFFLESLLRPIGRGAYVLEIPGKWIARNQGVRHIERSAYLNYINLVLKLRFKERKK